MTLQGIHAAHRIHTEIDLATCEVEHLTGISVHKQRECMMDSGLDWLQLITGGDSMGMKNVPATEEFWGFWKLVWLYADKEFIRWARCMLQDEVLERHELGTYYYATHRVSFDNKLINTPATEAGYHTVIKHLATKR